MKKIVLNASELISISDVGNNSKVGIQWTDGQKTMVIRTSYGFIGVEGSLNTNNSWSRETMQDYIETSLGQKGSQAFYFNKSSELFKWMSE